MNSMEATNNLSVGAIYKLHDLSNIVCIFGCICKRHITIFAKRILSWLEFRFDRG